MLAGMNGPMGSMPPAAVFNSTFDGSSDPRTSAMAAAYLAQQSQLAAVLALNMNYMPQFPPEYLARAAAGQWEHDTPSLILRLITGHLT